jgi:hypothetical protein
MGRHRSQAAGQAEVPINRRVPGPTEGRAMRIAAGIFGVSGAIRVFSAVLTPLLFDPRAGDVIFLSTGADAVPSQP